MDDSKIIEERDINEIVSEILDSGEKVKDSPSKTVYLGEEYALIDPDKPREEKLKRLFMMVPGRLMPETFVRTLELNGSKKKTFIIQERSDRSLQDELEKGREESLYEFIALMDSAVESDVVFTDPIPDNFRYFDNNLLISDIPDIESVKSFPESYQVGQKSEFDEDVQEMYADAAWASAEYLKGYCPQDVLDLFKEESEFCTTASLDKYDEIMSMYGDENDQ